MAENGSTKIKEKQRGAPIFLVTGGVGASGELLVKTVLAQFPAVQVPIVIEAHVSTAEQVRRIVQDAAREDATVVHTLVHAPLRDELLQSSKTHGVTAFDLLGGLMEHLTQKLDQDPVGQPGLYRHLYQSYFRRIEAIEYTVAHDDGQRVSEIDQADIVLLGVSRVGKTPLSIYLSMQGWKVANIPIVAEIDPPEELEAVDPRRVVGLTIEPQQLIVHRRSRRGTLGIGGGRYEDRQHLAGELRTANHLYARHGFAIVDVTDKPIETTADEVIAAISR